MTEENYKNKHCIFVVDNNRKLVKFSESCEEILGKKLVIGDNIERIFDKDMVVHIDKCLENGEEEEFDYELNNNFYRIVINICKYLQGDNIIKELFIFFNDDNKISLTKIKYDKIVENVVDAVITINSSGEIQTFNEAAIRMFGYSKHEIINQNISVLMPEPYSSKHPQYIARYLETKEPKIIGTIRKLIAKRRNGSLFEMELSVSKITDNLFVGVVRDISEMVKKQKQIKQLRAANSIKNEYLSRISHELRTPLNSIIGFTQIMEIYSKLSQDDEEYVKLIMKSAKHLLSLINDVLNISKIESGKLSYSLEEVNLLNIIDESKDMLSGMGKDKNVQIIYNKHNLNYTIKSDYQKIKQVILNILSNAIKYNIDYGMVMINAKDDDSEVRIEISDTGIGICEEMMSRLFIPFDRCGAENTAISGTGLGLVLSKSLLEGMNCRIEVTSEGKDKGSKFYVICPMIRKNPEIISVKKVHSKIIRPDPDPDNSNNAKILYIEDNLTNIRLIEQIIRKYNNIQLLTALQGGLGFEIAKEEKPNLILLDLHLPDMYGSEVLKKIRNDPELKNANVVIVSADASKHQIQKLKELGANDYITKPIDVIEFTKIINKELQE